MPALRAELTRSSNPLTLWARLQARDTVIPGIRRLVLPQVAFTFSAGYYFYFITFLSHGPLRLDARGSVYLFIFFSALSIMFNYASSTYFADRLLTRRTIIWLAVLGAPMLLGYGLVGTSKPAFWPSTLLRPTGASCLA